MNKQDEIKKYNKPLRVFRGENSSGTPTEAAESETGEWFQRWYQFNGYQKSWTKWSPFEPTWSTTITNAYTGETTEREEPALECGFRTLCQYRKTPRYRLPL